MVPRFRLCALGQSFFARFLEPWRSPASPITLGIGPGPGDPWATEGDPNTGRRRGLDWALVEVLTELGHPDLTVRPGGNVGRGERSACVSGGDKPFHVDLWNQGVRYAGGWAENLNEVGRALIAFNVEMASVDSMRARFSWLETDWRGPAHEAGPERYVAEAWRNLEHFLAISPGYSQVLPLVCEAARRPELRQLLPFTSLLTLCFSRTTGYPFTRVDPVAGPVEAGRFRVLSADRQTVLGEGNAMQAVDILVAKLAPGHGPAIHGTA